MSLFPSRCIPALLLLTMLVLPVRAAGSPQLKSMDKQDDLAGTLVRFEFSEPPTYRVAGSGQRVDLFFAGTTVKPNISLLREDGRIIKVLLAQSREELMVSLLLRQIPARVVANTGNTPAMVQLELFWQEGSDERPAIAFRISGLPTRQEHGAVSAPGQPSKYSGQWRKFFDSYQSPFSIGAPLAFSMPELPPPPANLFSPDRAELLAKIALGDWSGVPLDPVSPTDPLPLRLLQAEALLRQDRTKDALDLLDNFLPGGLPRELEARAVYLHGLGLARTEDPYRAQTRLTEMAVPPSADLYPYYLLLSGELALARGQFQEALEILGSSKSAWPESLQNLRSWRTADALADKDPDEALKIYRTLLRKNAWPKNRPFTLSQAGGTFLHAGDWKEAENAYRQLIDGLQGPAQGMARFAAALSACRAGKTKEAGKNLWQLQRDLPGTESAYRAQMKLLDQGVLSGEEGRLLQAIREFETVSKEADSRILREEAAFKYSLALFLSGDRIRTIQALEKFRRDFAGGPLRNEAESLLAEILPPLVEKFVADGQDLQAVILVEKYRELLLERHGKWPFLPALAQAFTRLGLFERGCKVYLYLLEKAETRSQADRFYLPLASLYFDMDEYKAVEKYTRNYLVKFPRGEDRNAIFLLLVRSLQHLNRFEDAAELLKERSRPSDNQIELAAERIFWHLGEYGWVISCATRLGDGGEAIPPEGLLLQAEAMRRLGREKKALPLYQVLAEDGTFGDQATYRCGEILLAEGRRHEALNLFRKLVEKGDNSLWRQLAADALEAARF